MKNLTSISLIICVILLSSCGSGTEEQSTEDPGQGVEMEDEKEDNEKEIDPAQLPQVVVDSIQLLFPGAVVEEAEEVTGANGEISYEVEIKTDSSEIEALFSARGSLLEMEDESEEDDEDEDDE